MSYKIGLLLGLPLLTQAAEPPLHCREVLEAGARLACYDAWAEANPPGAPLLSLDGMSGRTPLPQLAAAPATPLPSQAAPTAFSSLSRQWDLDEDNKLGTFALRAHQPTYILPLWYQFVPNARPGSPTQQPVELFGQKLNNVEVKYQLSFKSKLWQNVLGTPADLWFGYTQQSHWQMYNKGQSSPFRDTDYSPELQLTAPLPADWKLGDWRLRMAGLGVLHQSNGQPDPLSRSWNRLVATVGAENGNLSLFGRWWYRIPEGRGDDDNPDLVKYMGHGDLQARYRWDGHTLGATLRYHPASGKGAAQLDWTFPVAGRLRGYAQLFSGYGENLLDYNHHSRGLGVGLMLTDWLAN